MQELKKHFADKLLETIIPRIYVWQKLPAMASRATL